LDSVTLKLGLGVLLYLKATCITAAASPTKPSIGSDAVQDVRVRSQ
jgi:hypothetical protein